MSDFCPSMNTCLGDSLQHKIPDQMSMNRAAYGPKRSAIDAYGSTDQMDLAVS